MDFPAFHLDFLGNRGLIAVIAVLHVLINHALAVGAMPLITLMEWWGYRKRDADFDHLAYRILAVCFIVTTTVGALTGVGIWFSTSLVNPNAIGSLIRVFFWAWFTEWFVFVCEVCLILAYFLTWKSWSLNRKRLHIGVGVVLSICSWLTMAIIAAILGFMMDTGHWPEHPTLLRGLANPIYLPQLAFRTPYAMVAAGLFCLFLVYFFTRRHSAIRVQAIRFTSIWTLVWVPLLLLGAVWYWDVIPTDMLGNVAVALGTQAFESWHDVLAWIIAGASALVLLVVAWGTVKPRYLPRVALLVPFILCLCLLGYFERVREFVRKPEIIEDYMYANGIRRDLYPLLQRDGILAHATYVPMRTITDRNRIDAGKEIFRIACTRCHTTNGINGVVDKLTGLYGKGLWQGEAIKGYVANMHNIRPFMPPFPGTDEELDALTEYLLSLRSAPAMLPGAQTAGVSIPVSGEGRDPTDSGTGL